MKPYTGWESIPKDRQRAILEGRIALLLPLVSLGDKVAARSVRAMRRELANLPHS